MSRHTNQKGFTIVELLIVIVVIAILAAISIVAYTGIQERARNSAAVSVGSQVIKKADAYYAINGTYPVSAAEFNNATNKEPNLEGLKVTINTGAAPTGASANSWFATTGQASAKTQFDAGNRALYSGTATGYSVTYLKGAGVETVSKGTAPTGTLVNGTNENI